MCNRYSGYRSKDARIVLNAFATFAMTCHLWELKLLPSLLYRVNMSCSALVAPPGTCARWLLSGWVGPRERICKYDCKHVCAQPLLHMLTAEHNLKN